MSENHNHDIPDRIVFIDKEGTPRGRITANREMPLLTVDEMRNKIITWVGKDHVFLKAFMSEPSDTDRNSKLVVQFAECDTIIVNYERP